MIHQQCSSHNHLHSESHEKSNVALSSVWAAGFLTVIKIVAGIVTGSLGIISEAAHSALDLGAAIITYFAVRFSDKPADRRHTYGHHKIESFSALIATGLLLITCFWIITEAIKRFINPSELDIGWIAFGTMGISLVIDISRSIVLSRAAKKYHSQALEADALHFTSDIWSTSVVIVGLLFVFIFNWHWADPIAALLVAIWVLVVSFRLGKRTVEVLLDTAPSETTMKQIEDAIRDTPGVESFSELRVRKAGAQTFIDMRLAIGRTIPFEQAHTVVETVEHNLAEIVPNSDIVIHADPQATSQEQTIDKIRLIANALFLTVHNIQITEIGQKFSVNLHLELAAETNFEQAHEIASQLEDKIKLEIPNVTKVTTHLETANLHTIPAKDVTGRIKPLVYKIEQTAETVSGVLDCHDVTIQTMEGKFSVSLHCLLKPELSLPEVHEIATEIEKKIKGEFPEVAQITVHSEPAVKL
ncbi:MAG: cation-efflux pump [bacterium]|nr:cation-efflux pump [bacterium]